MPFHQVLPTAPVYVNAQYSNFTEIHGDQINIYNPAPVLTASSPQEVYLAALNPVNRVPYYDTMPKCFKGSRQWILDKIYAWLDDFHEQTPNVLWLSGGEGAGKSALASTLLSNLQGAGRLGGYWLCKRDNDLLSDPASIWRTISFDLAHMDSEVAKRVAKNIRQNKVQPARADVELHFRVLIEDPVKKCWEEKWKAYMASPKENEALDRRCPPMGDLFSVSSGEEDFVLRFPVIVIDALNECGPSPSQATQHRHLLDTIARWRTLHPCIKLLVTSREQPTVVSPSFGGECSHIDLKIGFGLQSIDPQIDFDIQYFFEQSVLKIAYAQQPPLHPQWASPFVIKWLTCCAGGSFKWADMVVRHLEQGVPSLKLDIIVGGTFRGKGEEIEAIKRVTSIMPFHSWRSWIVSNSVENLHVGSSSSMKNDTANNLNKAKIFSRRWWHRQRRRSSQSNGLEDKTIGLRRNNGDTVASNWELIAHSSTVSDRLAEMIASLSMDKPEDESLISEICDLATANKHSAKEAAEALMTKFLSSEPFAQLYATRLWALMLWHASEPFIQESTSPSFLHVIELVLTSSETNNTVREQLMDLLSAVTYASRYSAKGSEFHSLWMKVKPSDKPDKGTPLNEDDPRFQINFSPSRSSVYSQGQSTSYKNSPHGTFVSSIPVPLQSQRGTSLGDLLQ